MVRAGVVLEAHTDTDVGGRQLDVSAVRARRSNRCHQNRLLPTCPLAPYSSADASSVRTRPGSIGRSAHSGAQSAQIRSVTPPRLPRSAAHRSASPTGAPGRTPPRTRSRRSARPPPRRDGPRERRLAHRRRRRRARPRRRRPQRGSGGARSPSRPGRPARPHPDAGRALRRVRHRLRAVARREGRRRGRDDGRGRRGPPATARRTALAVPPRLARWSRSGATTFPDVQLVDSTRLRSMKDGPERRAAALAAAGSTPSTSTTPTGPAGSRRCSTASACSRFGWDAQHERILDDLLDMGIDGVYSDHVDRMVDAFDAGRSS